VVNMAEMMDTVREAADNGNGQWGNDV
jgi:hypothetical protein